MAAEGDQIDLSPLLAAAYGSGQAVGALVRIVEDGDSTAARLQVDVDGTANGVHWTTIGRLDDIHLGDTVNVILNSSQPAGTTLTLQEILASRATSTATATAMYCGATTVAKSRFGS